jgi:hypothetical protein
MTLRHLGPAALCLVDGEAVGTWTWDGARVVVHPVAAITADVRARLEEAATATGAFIAQELGDAATRCMRVPRGPSMLAGELGVEE